MNKEILIPSGHEARIEGNKVIIEQKDSEDERIRKALIRFFKHTHNWVNLKYDGDEIVAYLEKQKEQKPIVKIPKFRAGDTIHLKNSNAEYTIEAISSSGYHGKGWSLTFDAEPDYELVSEDKEKQKEQKPAEWSEEDEKMFSFVRMAIRDDDKKFNPQEMRRILKWFKSLRPQLKPEWSENEIRTIVDDYAEGRDTYTSCINRLKSLRPQIHWKPSKEQMEVLFKYAEQNNYDGSALTSLYNDLQKVIAYESK